jgi:hypothetical protein
MFKNHEPSRRIRSRLSYANVTASLALFVALGGTAAAAVTLAPDSVGSPQIRQDAVRSPEIAAGGVRSSELRDEGIKAADISTAAQTALRGELRVAQEDNTAVAFLPECDADGVTSCPNHLVLDLSSDAGSRTVESQPGRNWLVHAKLTVDVDEGPSARALRCGLVDTSDAPDALLDEAVVPQRDESVALSAVVKKRAGNPTIALRCNSPAGDQVAPEFAKLTALEVGDVTGP